MFDISLVLLQPLLNIRGDAIGVRRLADILPGHVRKLIELLCHLWDNEPCHARKEAYQDDENEEDGEGPDANVEVFLDHSNERIE